MALEQCSRTGLVSQPVMAKWNCRDENCTRILCPPNTFFWAPAIFSPSVREAGSGCSSSYYDKLFWHSMQMEFAPSVAILRVTWAVPRTFMVSALFTCHHGRGWSRGSFRGFLWVAAADERGEEVLMVLLNLCLEWNRKLTQTSFSLIKETVKLRFN